VLTRARMLGTSLIGLFYVCLLINYGTKVTMWAEDDVSKVGVIFFIVYLVLDLVFGYFEYPDQVRKKNNREPTELTYLPADELFVWVFPPHVLHQLPRVPVAVQACRCVQSFPSVRDPHCADVLRYIIFFYLFLWMFMQLFVGQLNRNYRQDWAFGISFFITRVAYFAGLYYGLVDAAVSPFVLTGAGFVFLLHVYWFYSWVVSQRKKGVLKDLEHKYAHHINTLKSHGRNARNFVRKLSVVRRRIE